MSFADEGIIEKLRESGNFEVLGPNEARYKEWKIETEKAAEIAKKMKEKGFDADTIKELTGLKKPDIKKL